VELFFEVYGIAAPQGSKKSIGNGRFIEASKKLPAWRKRVREAAADAVASANWVTLSGPTELSVVFFLPRPKSVTATRRPLPTVPPDIDKLVRGVFDSCTDAGVWDDDSLVCKISAHKMYDDAREPGASITVRSLLDLGVSLPGVADNLV
jgi:Holliday junction resolvase RusA-like endonuclease